MPRKKKHAEPANHERWLVSYADFITLLFAFFTTLYAISVVDAQKVSKVANSMQEAFGTATFQDGSRRLSLDSGGVPPGGKLAIVSPISPKAAARTGGGRKIPLAVLKSALESAAAVSHFSDKVQMVMDGRGLIVRLAEIGFYDSGAGELKPDALAVVDILAETLSNLDNDIRVEGHTDNVPIKTSRYPSNWELSTARATILVQYLVRKHGFDPNRLSASGCGEFQPLAENDTPEHRALNRHVDIIVMNESTMRQEPQILSKPPEDFKAGKDGHK
jgi:chemotaxis protein MotB